MELNKGYRNLGAGIVLQAVKDYCEPCTTDAMRKAIIKELKSDYLVQLSDGLSSTAAVELEKNPKEIAKRLNKYKEEFTC